MNVSIVRNRLCPTCKPRSSQPPPTTAHTIFGPSAATTTATAASNTSIYPRLSPKDSSSDSSSSSHSSSSTSISVSGTTSTLSESAHTIDASGGSGSVSPASIKIITQDATTASSDIEEVENDKSGDKCSQCSGRGVVPQEVTLTINLYGKQHGDRIIFEKEADETVVECVCVCLFLCGY